MRYLKEIQEYIIEKDFVAYWDGKPIYLYKCDLKNAYKHAEYFKERKLTSPCFVHTVMSIFNRIKEYAIFIAYDENYRKLSEKSKEFLLAHELGHIVNQNPCTHELSDEGPADKYALDHVEKPSRSEIKKMAEWISHYGRRCYENTYKEFVDRFINRAFLDGKHGYIPVSVFGS